MTEETLQEKMARLKGESKAPVTPVDATPQENIKAAEEDLSNLQQQVVQEVREVKAQKNAKESPRVALTPVVAKVQEAPPEKTYHVFHHTLPNCSVTIPTGGRVCFVDHRYITDNEIEIAHLQKEIRLGSKRISVIAGQEVMTATELDPMAALKKKHFDEFAALQKEAARKIKAGEPLSQSESEVQALTPGTTADISELAAGQE